MLACHAGHEGAAGLFICCYSHRQHDTLVIIPAKAGIQEGDAEVLISFHLPPACKTQVFCHARFADVHYKLLDSGLRRNDGGDWG